MPTYEITSPDGRTAIVEAPTGVSEQEAIAFSQENWAGWKNGGRYAMEREESAPEDERKRLSLSDEDRLEALVSSQGPRVEPSALPATPMQRLFGRERQAAPTTPMARLEQQEYDFDKVMNAWRQATGGALKPGQNVYQAASEWSGIPDPRERGTEAQLAQLKETGELVYGETVPYALAKTGASVAGWVGAGPAGATAAEAAVRGAALTYNLQRAINAGVIDEERAADIMTAELTKGVAVDAAFNFGIPILSKLVANIPGVKGIVEKVTRRLGSSLPKAKQEARVIESRAKLAETPEAKRAVELLSERAGVVPTPGQVTGKAGVGESAARLAHMRPFDEAQAVLRESAERMRQGALAPEQQPGAKRLGELVQEVAEDTVRAVKTRLRPAFEAANRAGVAADMDDVVRIAQKALAKHDAVPKGIYTSTEASTLRQIVADLTHAGTPAQPSMVLGAGGAPAFGIPATPAITNKLNAEAVLSFISARKGAARRMTAEGAPPSEFKTIIDDITRAADAAYMTAAQRAGRPDVVKDLVSARNDYKQMMATVYDDAVKQALKKNPEDVGRVFWQSGNVSELEQLQQLLKISQREGVRGAQEARELSGAMARGFLQEAMRDVKSAANWSQTLKADPLKRRTWETLTSAPGGDTFKQTVQILEEVAKIAERGQAQLGIGGELYAIPLARAARGGFGVSYVSGVFNPGVAVAGLALDGITKAMATAYTQGSKGVVRDIARVLRASGAGTPAAVKALQETLPRLEKWAAEEQIDIFEYDKAGEQ